MKAIELARALQHVPKTAEIILNGNTVSFEHNGKRKLVIGEYATPITEPPADDEVVTMDGETVAVDEVTGATQDAGPSQLNKTSQTA